MVQAIHTAVRGRARFKVQGLYRSEPLRRHLEHRLPNGNGIYEVSASPLTGNVLVVFDPTADVSGVTSCLQALLSDFDRLNGAGEEERSSQTHSVEAPSKRALRRMVTGAHDQLPADWHAMDLPDVASRLRSDVGAGLSTGEAAERLAMYGPNMLPEAVPRSDWEIFFDQFNSVPVALLGAAAGIAIVMGAVVDAAMIAGVVGLNAIIGYATESRSESILHSLKRLVRPTARVIRDGIRLEIAAEDIVVGDVLDLGPGQYVAADSRLIQTEQLTTDESALTGESLPIVKSARTLEWVERPLGDRFNMVYMGTLVTGGRGRAIVVATGSFTEMGAIQQLVAQAQSPETPLERQLNRMGTQLVVVAGGVCGLVFVVGLLQGYGFLPMLEAAICLAVAAVPEGLPTIATSTLAIGMNTMQRHKVLVRRLNAMETLGSVQTICLDKTGTITYNRMQVVEIHTGLKRIVHSNGDFLMDGARVNPFTHDELLRVLHASALCSEVDVTREGGDYRLEGSSTETALVQAAISAGVDPIQLRARHPIIDLTPRGDNRNYMRTVHASGETGCLVFLKGSPTEILPMCHWHIQDGKVAPLTEDVGDAIETENERMAGNALRVLGAAYQVQETQGDEARNAQDHLIWLGLIGMTDPIRDRVKQAIGTFHGAGINTVMITGDQGPTAYAIGKELNLSQGRQLEILDSAHLASLDPEVMTALAQKVHVFARVSPAHKLQIVQALQSGRQVVAMTGDGINDGPALKAADIGVAMGHTGTDVAREVADVVLEDDELETMVVAISQGRTAYNNIRKSVRFLLATNLSEIMVTGVSLIGGLGQPLTPMQLLWINLFSDIAPGLALAVEPPEPDVLSRPPRDPETSLVQASDFKRIAFESATMSAGAMGAYGFGIVRYGLGPQAGTMCFMSLMTAQLLHALSCRSETHRVLGGNELPSNPYMSVAFGGSLAVQWLALATPWVRNLLGLVPLGVADVMVVGGTAVAPFLVNEATKPGVTQTGHCTGHHTR